MGFSEENTPAGYSPIKVIAPYLLVSPACDSVSGIISTVASTVVWVIDLCAFVALFFLHFTYTLTVVVLIVFMWL